MRIIFLLTLFLLEIMAGFAQSQTSVQAIITLIDDDTLKPDDVEMLQDMIVAAVNEAMKQAEEASGAMLGKMTGGLGGGFPF